MNLIIFYDTRKYKEEFYEVLESQSVFEKFSSIKFVSLEEEFSSNDFIDPFVSVFLINPQHISSSRFVHYFDSLKKEGIQNRSILFVLNDKEILSNEDCRVVESELLTVLHKFNYHDPAFVWISTYCFLLYKKYVINPEDEALKKEARFLKWNEEKQTYVTIRELVEENLMCVVQKESGIELLEQAIEKRLLSNTRVALRKDPLKTHIYVYNINPSIKLHLEKQAQNVIYEVRDKEELTEFIEERDFVIFYSVFDKELQSLSFSHIPKAILLIDGAEKKEIWELKLQVKFLKEKYPYLIVIPINTFYLELLNKLQAGEVNIETDIVNNLFVIASDSLGFPMPKTVVEDWEQKLLENSGLKYLEEKLIRS